MPDVDVDALIDGYEPRVESVQICLRQDLLAEHRRLEQDLVAASASASDSDSDPTEIAEQVAAVEAELASASTTFRFQALGREDYANLIAAHAPTKEQREADKGLDHNPETFPAALIAASSIDPKLTEAQAGRIEKKWRLADFRRLYDAALMVNVGVTDEAPKSVLAGVILGRNASSGTMSARKGSRGRSSSGGRGGRSRPTSTTKKAG